MAILEQLPGISVTVSTAGGQLAEYDDSEGNDQEPPADRTVEDCSNARLIDDVQAITNVGEIVIKVFRKTSGKSTSPRSSSTRPIDAVTEVAEKAVKGKAISHGTSFLPPVLKGKGSILTSSKYLDGRDQPIAVLRFKYRSKDTLQKLFIIPRSPTPDSFDRLSAAEKEELARQRYADLSLKNEVKCQSLKNNTGIKREFDITGMNETIDLTGDGCGFRTNQAVTFKKVKMADGTEAIDLIN